MPINEGRRQWLSAAAVAGVGLVSARGSGAEPEKPADVNATEDLMREHGVLRRVLLVYGEGLRVMALGQTAPADVLASGARLVKRFVEGYHEKLEEEQVFPRMEKAKLHVELVHTLKAQHEAGRRLTNQVLANATAAGLAKPASRQIVIDSLTGFIRMYEPHAALEDTVLFPAFHALFTEKQFDELGDQFEEQEHKLLGGDSFEGAVKEVADLEKALGIYDLNLVTPR